jgi:Zn-dependent protease/predicted transcriptional regulator
VAIARGIRVRAITLFIFGGVAQTEKEADIPSTEFWVAIAGPLVSFALAALFYFLERIFMPINASAAESMGWLASINMMVAIFNLIPGFPLDGGRVFRALVWGLTGDVTKGIRWAVMSGRIVAYSLMALGLLIAMRTGLVLNGLWMLGIGWFLLIAAEASGRGFTINRILGAITVRAAMQHDVPYVDAALSVATWMDAHVLPTGRRGFLVKDDHSVVGLVTMSDCNKVGRESWSMTSVREVMTPATQLHTVTPDTDLAEVLRNMGYNSFNQVPVVDEGEIIGWIDRERILKILHRRIDTRR